MNLAVNLDETLAWLRTAPLTGVVLTLAGYRIGLSVQRRTGGHALAQPVLIAIIVVAAAMWALDLSYREYLSGGSLVGFLLGPATVALAVPLHRQAGRLRAAAVPLLLTVPLGAAVSIGTALLVVRAAGGSDELARTLAPKAATTPVSIALSETIGGIASLTAAVTIIAGILGAVAGPAMLTLLRVRDRRARGVALGAVSHGIGTSRALREHPLEGAFSGLSMGLTALATSLVLPLLLLL